MTHSLCSSLALWEEARRFDNESTCADLGGPINIFLLSAAFCPDGGGVVGLFSALRNITNLLNIIFELVMVYKKLFCASASCKRNSPCWTYGLLMRTSIAFSEKLQGCSPISVNWPKIGSILKFEIYQLGIIQYAHANEPCSLIALKGLNQVLLLF